MVFPEKYPEFGASFAALLFNLNPQEVLEGFRLASRPNLSCPYNAEAIVKRLSDGTYWRVLVLERYEDGEIDDDCDMAIMRVLPHVAWGSVATDEDDDPTFEFCKEETEEIESYLDVQVVPKPILRAVP